MTDIILRTTDAPERHSVKVTFQTGQTLFTEINGTRREIEDYYRVGKVFNVGSGENDLELPVTKLEFLS